MKKIFKIIKGIITFLLIVVLCLVLFQKFSNNKIAIGNVYIFQVASESMFPEYEIGDIIVVNKVDPAELVVGDDVTYHAVANGMEGLIITHRIIEKRQEDGKYYFITKGINNTVEDPEISQNELYGKVMYHTIIFSFVGRLMTNVVVYYILFISVGVAFSYELISSFMIKNDDDKEDEEEDVEEVDDNEEADIK